MNLVQILAEGGREIGADIDPLAAGKFEIYSELLRKWASKINLTSIRTPEAIAVGHFLDSLTLLRHIKPSSSVLDIGAGAGFPGIPIKICRPSISLVLTDSREKKVFFMREVIRELGLDKTRAVKARAGKEDEKIGGGFDIAVSRAVARTPEIARVALPLVKEGGILLVMKGEGGAREWKKEKGAIADTNFNLELETMEETELPGGGGKRCILVLRKTK